MKNQTKPIDKSEQISRNFLNISRYTLFDNISEMISEWWSCSQKDIPTFLKDEDLSDIINEQEFTDIVLGKYYFSPLFLSILKKAAIQYFV